MTRVLNFRGHTNGVPGDLLAALNNFRAQGWFNTNVPETLRQMRLKLDEKQQHQFDDPGPTFDRTNTNTEALSLMIAKTVAMQITPSRGLSDEMELHGYSMSRLFTLATSPPATTYRYLLKN
ncbi:hypothetical protein Ptr902_09920 [Pyrenophora tritici-repentis]|nr:hypothetical protein L13192_08710 [Pyrenophora tritici-repentis]KAI2478954.1 hypothetical protein Ptr902_09920 [Pyrenophora tritici-repentis]